MADKKISELTDAGALPDTAYIPIANAGATQKVQANQFRGQPGLDGAPGPVGATGAQGATGTPAGATGNTGATGATGAPGLDGIQGNPGATGAGVTGATGVQGGTGPTGPQGATGVGSTGATGPVGLDGLDGARGPAGVTGATGVGVTGATGPEGTPGLDGARGSTGSTGPQGNDGVDGLPGATGSTGPSGPQGATGSPAGATGNTGAAGATGATGPAGLDGVDGAMGATGVGSVSLPSVKHTQFAGTSAAGITISGYTPVTDDRIILVLDGFNTGQATAVSSTNTTWTKMDEFNNAGGQKGAIWIGVCAASPGTSITVTHPNTFMSLRIVIVADLLTPTLVQVANFEVNTIGALTGVTEGHFIIVSAGTDNTGNRNAMFCAGFVPVGPLYDIVPVAVGYAATDRIDMAFSAAAGAGFIAEVT